MSTIAEPYALEPDEIKPALAALALVFVVVGDKLTEEMMLKTVWSFNALSRHYAYLEGVKPLTLPEYIEEFEVQEFMA